MENPNKTSFNTTWSRLESALNLEDAFIPDPRPKTTASLNKSAIQSPQKTHIFRTVSTCKSCRTRLKSRTSIQSSRSVPSVPGLASTQVQSLYKSKCADLGIPILPDQEKRFFLCCHRNFQNRNLQMKESGLGLITADAIANILKASDYFAFIYLSRNLLKDEGVNKIAKSLLSSMSVVHLDVSSNEISPEGASEMFRVLNGHRSLASIDISSHEGLHRNRVCSSGAKAVAELLRSTQVLSVLNLAGTCLGPEGLELIIEGLEDNSSLSALNLSNNAIGHKPIERLAKTLMATDLRDLDLSFNKISNEGCEFLSLMLSGGYLGYSVLEKLNLSENEISTEGVSKLFQSLRINSQLTNLNLKKNDFTSGLSSYLSQSLSENISLQFLDLSHCLISCDGLFGFSEGLFKNNGLKTLILSNNKISDKGAEFLAAGLAKNKVLTTLNLTNNFIRDKGGLALVKALQENSTLNELFLKNNCLKDESASKFSEITRWKKNILKLTLNLNPCNLKYIEILKNNIKANNNYQKQKLIPELHKNVVKLKVKDSALNEVQSKLAQKQKERNELELKIRTTGGKLDEIKVGEEVKLSELKHEYETVREVSTKLSHEIEEMSFSINVRFKQKVKYQSEKMVDELTEKIEKMQVQIKEFLDKSKK